MSQVMAPTTTTPPVIVVFSASTTAATVTMAPTSMALTTVLLKYGVVLPSQLMPRYTKRGVVGLTTVLQQ